MLIPFTRLVYSKEIKMATGESRMVRRPLIGTEDANVDEKGRILFSRTKKERLGDVFAIALCEKGCLAAYSLEVWNQMWTALSQYSPLDLTPRRYMELLYNFADDEVKFDPQCRAVVSKRLRDAGKITKQVRLIGDGDRVEIWDPTQREIYEKDKSKYEQARREEFERAAMQVTDIWSRR